MGKFDELKKDNNRIINETKIETSKFIEIADDFKRVKEIYSCPNIIISNINEQFKSATKLDKTDITFLFFAIALQCVRQYFLTNFELKEDRPDDKQSADDTKGHKDEHSDRHHKLYNPSIAEIIASPVPFDAQFGSAELSAGIGGGYGHRAKTLGHDPILGWIFGTANIATSTLTAWNFNSYHIKTGLTKDGRKMDKLSSHADTKKVFLYTKDKLLDEGLEGKGKIGVSLLKEAIHLKSDINSKAGLPLPIVSTISPEFAEKLARKGVDTANVINVGKQSTYAVFINSIISMIHTLFYDESVDISENLYEVRTRKILSYSNVIASASNVIVVAVTEAVALLGENPELAKKGLSYLDIGGILVTCYRLISDHKFIKEVKAEFLEHEWYNVIYGEEYKSIKEVENDEQ